MVPSSRLAARIFELSHAQLHEIAVAGCEASPKVTNHAEAILAANKPLAQRLVEGVLLSSDLAPHVLAPLPLEDSAAAAVCSLWADGWKATGEGRRRLTQVAFDLPAGVLEEHNCHGMAAIPGNDEKLAVCSGETVTILDRSMTVVTSITDVRTDEHEAGGYVQISGSITADEQSIYIAESLAGEVGDHLRIALDGTELARCEDPNGCALGRNGRCVVAPGGLLFCKGFGREETEDQDPMHDSLQDEMWDEIIALDAHSLQLRYRFGKSLFGGYSAASGVGRGGSACGLAVVGEELFVCDMMNDRLQVFSLAGEHRRSVTGGWRQPSSLCVIKDRLYLVESHTNMTDSGQSGAFGPSPYEDNERGRRIFVLSLQGETLQVYPIPARQWNRFSTGELFCFDGKLLVPIGDYEGDGEGEQLMCDYTHLEIVALLGA